MGKWGRWGFISMCLPLPCEIIVEQKQVERLHQLFVGEAAESNAEATQGLGSDERFAVVVQP